MTINGKTYTPIELTFSTMRKMEKAGLSISDLATRPLEFITLYLALSANIDEDAAAAEIDAHIKGGGDLGEISEALNNAVAISGFFRVNEAEEKKV